MKLVIQSAFLALFGIGLAGAVVGDATVTAIGLGGCLGLFLSLWAWGDDL
jgi:hypothetical protein